MTRDELLELIAEVQRHPSELVDIEVKAARGGTPRRLFEALSAFANHTGGGVLLLGLDEDRAFEVVGIGNVQRLQEDIASLAASDMEPVLRPEFTVEMIEGKTVVAVEVPEVPATQKPCYYKPAGLPGGAYIRVGPSNRRMSDYEVFGYHSARGQPTFDTDPVPGATLDDLDRSKLDAYVARLRQARARPAYLDRPFPEVLTHLRIVQMVEGVPRPTLAGLLVFGTYPQQFEPQLVITYLQYYGTTEEEKAPSGARFLDNQKFEGTIPEMVEDAVTHVLANIRKSSLIDGVFRRDIPEYPQEAIREAIVNAVAHRDYSHFVRGSYIQVRLFADRLEIQSPGGLYGNVTEETLEDEQSTRNRVLVRLLEDLHLVENRGSGIRTMVGAMRSANLEPPRFEDKRASFWVAFRNHTLMNADAVAWLNQFAGQPLTDRQRRALVYLRRTSRLTNSDYRRLNHVDTVTATRELRGLVQAALIEQHSTGRWAYYTLSVPIDVRPLPPQTDEERILGFVREHGWINNAECQRLLNVPFRRASTVLTGMYRRNLLRREGRSRWTIYRLP